MTQAFGNPRFPPNAREPGVVTERRVVPSGRCSSCLHVGLAVRGAVLPLLVNSFHAKAVAHLWRLKHR